MNDFASLRPDWREQIAQVGKTNFELAEMIRLGFLDDLNLSGLADLRRQIEANSAELQEVLGELERVTSELDGLPEVQAVLREIRRQRIERVAHLRKFRKAEKALEQIQRVESRMEDDLARPRFLGRGVSSKLSFVGGDDSALASAGLPVVHDLEELSNLMKLAPRSIQWLCFERAVTATDHYSRFEIPKRTGGLRLISAPKPTMRQAQEWIKDSVLSLLMPSDFATGFREGVSILDNATPHIGAKLVIRMDIKDFFPSITFSQIQKFFEELGYNPGMATIFALLCTDAPRVRVEAGDKTRWVSRGYRSLPQGACTSPGLANLIARDLDERVSGQLVELDQRWTYTRYADDLVISTPAENPWVGKALSILRDAVKAEGFKVNDKKTAVMRRPHRQTVTGLVVSEDSVRIQRKDLKRVRSLLYRCERDGVEVVSEQLGSSALHVVRGHLAYIQMIMPETAARLRAKHPWVI
ncbi:MAG: reverse transcriptase domain-containing protein [Actinomycetes bacterium]